MKVREPKPVRGHVARSIAKGARPFLTCTVSGETFEALDRLAAAAGLSRGRMVDRLVATAVRFNVAPLQVEEATDLDVILAWEASLEEKERDL